MRVNNIERCAGKLHALFIEEPASSEVGLLHQIHFLRLNIHRSSVEITTTVPITM